ncbi:expressed unknown protein [Seminavis robusta]|uniref:Uncharacterized protein n=1 Tax=Seminavis robusta TaxID=568900 RepID=A0A9N8EXU9_9STRA|nr:expressed unknown protein [Seminavis robusta]|eukprot:Sro2113_g315020.1 n/a (129) ;mRNA; f:1585-1971
MCRLVDVEDIKIVEGGNAQPAAVVNDTLSSFLVQQVQQAVQLQIAPLQQQVETLIDSDAAMTRQITDLQQQVETLIDSDAAMTPRLNNLQHCGMMSDHCMVVWTNRLDYTANRLNELLENKDPLKKQG